MTERTDIPGLDTSTEKAFQLDTGELVVCSIVRPQPQNGTVAVTVTARMVDETGATKNIGGHDVVMPGHTISVLVETLGENPTILLPQIAAAMEREAQKARGFAVALNALASFAPAQ